MLNINASWVGLVFLLWSLATTSTAMAQTEKPSAAAQSKLVEGLLDLLNEPAPSPTPPATNSALPLVKPESLGLDGEDLGKHASNPLEPVRKNMLVAAGYLGRGNASSETQTIQSDIVLRLDDLIAQLENQSSRENQQQREQQQLQQQSSQQRQQRSSSPSSNSRPEESNSEQLLEPGKDHPGEQGEARNVIVDLSDPRALQQSVWGQLPEQVRQQMQSKMVERFLPSYRVQIEAYFQALLKQQE